MNNAAHIQSIIVVVGCEKYDNKHTLCMNELRIQ